MNRWAMVETMEQKSEDSDWLLDPEAFNTRARVLLVMMRGLPPACSDALRVSLGDIYFRLDRRESVKL